jgi:hypothetical protein
MDERAGPPRLPQVPISIKAIAPMTDKEQFETELIRMANSCGQYTLLLTDSLSLTHSLSVQ